MDILYDNLWDVNVCMISYELKDDYGRNFIVDTASMNG
jgi:hypothetical protein